MRVCDVMTRSVVTTTPTTLVKDAAVVLAGQGITLLPVLEDDRLVGVLTEVDVLRRRIPPDPRRRAWRGSQTKPPPTTVGEVMSSPPLTAHPLTDLAELAAMMIDRGFRSVPVVDDADRLVGIITRRDLVGTLVRDDALIAADVRKRLECYGTPDRWTVHVEQGSVTITDQYTDPADHHVALVLAQAVPGVVNAKVVHSSSQRV